MSEEKPFGEIRNVSEVLERIWAQALWAMSAVEVEASKMVSQMASVSGWSPEDARTYLRELSERLASDRRLVERRIDVAVENALTKLKMPRREDLISLQSRLSRLSERIEALVQKR